MPVFLVSSLAVKVEKIDKIYPFHTNSLVQGNTAVEVQRKELESLHIRKPITDGWKAHQVVAVEVMREDLEYYVKSAREKDKK